MATDEELWDILYECQTELVFNQGAEGHFEGWPDSKIQAYIEGQTRLFFNKIKSDEDYHTRILQEDKETVKKEFQNIFRKYLSSPGDISSKPQ